MTRTCLRAVVALAASAWILTPQVKGADIAAHQICASTAPYFVGPCFTIHARLEQGADNAVVHIWHVGTHRLLGYLGYADFQRGQQSCDLPADLVPALKAGKTIYADVTVRPITRKRQGHMQFVCIAAAKHLVVVDRPL
jgi:hypothetical protein